ncbi:MAG: YicC family protein [Synergistaceae bacterium]|nr:YicC family protein [Synergistaceae bacterium]
MLLSMTGFGSKSCEFPWGTVVFEASSINHKFQDFLVKLPPELASLENRLLNILRASIARGKVKMSASITWNPGAEIPLIDEDGLMNLYNQIKRITKRNSLEFSADISTLLLIPGVFEANNNLAARMAAENPGLLDELAKGAIKSLIDSKKYEGKKLEIKIRDDLEILEKNIADMIARWKVARDSAIDSIRTRIESVLEHYRLPIDEARIAEEVTLAADRWDVSEEIARLKSHTEKFKQILDDEESSGKKLDFMIQEILRELNTMGSKVADGEFRWLIVEAKTCVERIREQIQNVE